MTFKKALRALARRVHHALCFVGIDLTVMLQNGGGLFWYLRDYARIYAQRRRSDLPMKFGPPSPRLGDRAVSAGDATGHYFHQDLLVARRVFLANPHRHVDVGSRIDGFVAHVASFREIEVIDIRPLTEAAHAIRFQPLDLMGTLPPAMHDYCDSASCLHALEHFGLGRYGDPLRWDGHLVGLRNLHALLKPGGKLYLSFPIGPQRVEFNSQRVFALEYVIPLLERDFKIDAFAYVDDTGRLHVDVALIDEGIRNNFGCHFGCGIFELTKR